MKKNYPLPSVVVKKKYDNKDNKRQLFFLFLTKNVVQSCPSLS